MKALWDWCEDTQVSETETSEKDLHIYGKLVFTKKYKGEAMERGKFLQQMILEWTSTS